MLRGFKPVGPLRRFIPYVSSQIIAKYSDPSTLAFPPPAIEGWGIRNRRENEILLYL
ncbi:MAG: hypothetical protein ACR2JB_27835 [Bryobacteraceae bacterium]